MVEWEKSINLFKTLPERKAEAGSLLEKIIADLKKGCNPIPHAKPLLIDAYPGQT